MSVLKWNRSHRLCPKKEIGKNDFWNIYKVDSPQ